jgi:hypothetical protein
MQVNRWRNMAYAVHRMVRLARFQNTSGKGALAYLPSPPADDILPIKEIRFGDRTGSRWQRCKRGIQHDGARLPAH